jgi:hypothetical protein
VIKIAEVTSRNPSGMLITSKTYAFRTETNVYSTRTSSVMMSKTP